MRTTQFLVSILAVSSFALGGCDDLKEKLGLEAKKEAKKDDDDDDKKKKKKSSDDDEEEEDEASAKPSASASAAAAPTAAPTTPGTLPAPGKASSHLPGVCDVALTVNLSKLAAHPSFATKVMPALDGALTKLSTTGTNAAKVDAFLKDTGINARSFHEMAACVTDIEAPSPTVAMAFGGDLRPGTFIAAIEKVNPEASKNVKESGGIRLLSDKGTTMGQFSDGTLGLGQSEAAVLGMAQTNDYAVSKFRMDTGKEMFFTVSETVLAKAVAEPDAPPAVKSVKSIAGFVDLATSKVTIRVTAGSVDDAKALEGFIALMKTQMGSSLPGAPPGVAEALKNATTRLEGSDVLIESTLPATAIDALADLIVKSVNEKLASTDLSVLDGGAAATPTPTVTAKPTATGPDKPTPKPTPTATATVPLKPVKPTRPGLRIPRR